MISRRVFPSSALSFPRSQPCCPQRRLRRKVRLRHRSQSRWDADISIGSPKAQVTITEYASMSGPHCAAWGENVFRCCARVTSTRQGALCVPRIPARHQGGLLPRCWRAASPRGDGEKYLAVIAIMYQQLDPLLARTKETLILIGKLNGYERGGRGDLRDRPVPARQAESRPRIAFGSLKVDSTRPSSSTASA